MKIPNKIIQALLAKLEKIILKMLNVWMQIAQTL